MTTDEYVPSETTVRHAYVVIENRRDILAARAEFDRFLARVKRDAAREALDGLAEWADLRVREAATDRGADDWRRTRSAVAAYRDRNHPEEKQ